MSYIFKWWDYKRFFLNRGRIKKKIFLILFIFRREGREKERERNSSVRENIDQLSFVYALTRD